MKRCVVTWLCVVSLSLSSTVVRADERLGDLNLFSEEILLNIMSHLSAQDLRNLMRVSSAFYRLGKDESQWKRLALSPYREEFLRLPFGHENKEIEGDLERIPVSKTDRSWNWYSLYQLLEFLQTPRTSQDLVHGLNRWLKKVNPEIQKKPLLLKSLKNRFNQLNPGAYSNFELKLIGAVIAMCIFGLGLQLYSPYWRLIDGCLVLLTGGLCVFMVTAGADMESRLNRNCVANHNLILQQIQAEQRQLYSILNASLQELPWFQEILMNRLECAR